jgi:predicted N-acyltransferase
MLAAPGIAFDPPRLTAHIAAAVETREDLPVMCGINFLPRDPVPGIPGALRELGFQEFTGYQRSFLEIHGKSYDEYLENLGSRKRWSARRDRKRFVEMEQTISFSAGSEAMGEDLVRLQGYNKTKYGQFYDEAQTRTRFSELLSSTGEDNLVVRSHHGANCTGFAMFFRMGESLHALCAGFEETTDRVSPYFECLFYAPIEWACEHNIKEIDYGVGSAGVKAERGCTIADVATWYLQPVSRLPQASTG